MKSVESMRSMVDSFTYYEPCVLLEKIPIPIRMENEQNNCTNRVPEHVEFTNEETEELNNEEPNCKKLKTKKTDLEIPKLILSKNGDTFESKLKYSKLQPPEDSHLKTLPDRLNTKYDVEPSNNENCIIINHDKKEETKEIKKSVTNNSLLIGKIKIRNVNAINANFNEINYFETEKSDVPKTNSSFVFPPLGTKKLTLLCFEQLHKKYFNKNVQDTLVINNNILYMNMLTNMHCISRVNFLLSWEDKHVKAQNVYKLVVLYINYFEKLDKILQTNIIDLISIFDDSDFEHGFLMIILSLFVGLKMLSSNIFKKSNVLLAKLKKLQWEVIKDKNDAHNKIQATLESDTFCSCYYKISELIGEGSHTDPHIIECWKLFLIPAVLKITNFNSVTDAIVNATDVDKLEGLLEEASNKVRQNSYSLSDTKIKNLIALVNKSTQKNINSSDEMAQPSTSGFTTVENTSSMAIQNASTPNMVHTRSLRIEEPNTVPYCKSKVCVVKNASTFIPEESRDWFKKPLPVQSQQTSTRKKNSSTFIPKESRDWIKKHIPVQSQRTSTRKKNASTFIPEESKDWFKKSIPVQSQRTSTRKRNSVSRVFKLNYQDYSNTHSTNIPSLSIADRVKLRKTRNTLAAVCKTSEDSHKKLRSIKSEFMNTPSIVHSRITRSSKLNMNYDDPPENEFKKMHASNQIEVHEAKNTTTAVSSKPNDLSKLPLSIKIENSSHPHIFYVSVSEHKRLNKNSPLNTNISTTSTLNHGEVCQDINCSTEL